MQWNSIYLQHFKWYSKSDLQAAIKTEITVYAYVVIAGHIVVNKEQL